MDKTMRLPHPGHPIRIEPSSKRIVVKFGGRILADSRNALTLNEANYPPVHYIPRGDADMSLLQASDHSTFCPYKGDASYFDIVVDGERSSDAVWSYEHPFEAVAPVRDHLAFYPDRVDLFTA